LRDANLEGCHVEKEKKRRDGGALGGANIYWGWGSWGPLED